MRTVIILVLLIAASAASGKYFMPNFKANWFKAVEYCNYLGTRLAIVANGDNQTELIETVRKTDSYSGMKTEFWIGASDLAEEGHFTWQASGAGVRHSFWKLGQPDHAGKWDDCVEVRYFPSEQWDWQWNDLDCTMTRYFVCEDSEVAWERATF